MPLFRPEAVQLQWKMVSINAPLWSLYCTIQSAHSFPLLAIHYVYSTVCFAIAIKLSRVYLHALSAVKIYVLIFQVLYSDDPLTSNIERDRHIADAILILGHTGVLS